MNGQARQTKIRRVFIKIILLILIISCNRGDKRTIKGSIKIQNFHISDEKISYYDSVKISVILPPSYELSQKNYPVIYFLPGYNQNDSAIKDLKIDSLLDNSFRNNRLKEFIFVTFDNQNDNYNNWEGEDRLWSDFISNGLVETIDSRYRTITSPEKRALYGVSMGGEGALYNGLRNPDKYGIILSHSASIHNDNLEEAFEWAKPLIKSYFSPIYGSPITQKKWEENNIIWMVKNMEISKSQKIYFDVGIEDHLEFYKTNIKLNQKFNEKLIPHTFVLSHGGHGNKFYMKQMMEALKFWDTSISNDL